MASNVSMGKWAPKGSGVRDPKNPNKKNGMFWNPPRYQYFGGVGGAFTQAGTRGPSARAASGQEAVGPISDRGRGRG